MDRYSFAAKIFKPFRDRTVTQMPGGALIAAIAAGAFGMHRAANVRERVALIGPQNTRLLTRADLNAAPKYLASDPPDFCPNRNGIRTH